MEKGAVLGMMDPRNLGYCPRDTFIHAAGVLLFPAAEELFEFLDYDSSGLLTLAEIDPGAAKAFEQGLEEQLVPRGGISWACALTGWGRSSLGPRERRLDFRSASRHVSTLCFEQ